MADFVELEQRLTDALGRLSRGVEMLPTPADVLSNTRAEPNELDAAHKTIEALNEDLLARDATLRQLQTDLETALTAHSVAEDLQSQMGELTEERDLLSADNAALTAERDHLRNAAPLPVADDEADDLRAALTKLDAAQGQLKAMNLALVKVNKDLRLACEETVADADLINRTLETDLEAAKADHAADRAELAALKAALTPMLATTKEADNA